MTDVQNHSTVWTLTRNSAKQAVQLYFEPLVTGFVAARATLGAAKRALSAAPSLPLRVLLLSVRVGSVVALLAVALIGLVLPFTLPEHAAGFWEPLSGLNVSNTLLARILALLAIVVGGLTSTFAQGDSKRVLAGVVFGVGMAIGAINFLAWLL